MILQIDSEVENAKAFLILNEIIVTLKDVRVILRIIIITFYISMC